MGGGGIVEGGQQVWRTDGSSGQHQTHLITKVTPSTTLSIIVCPWKMACKTHVGPHRLSGIIFLSA